MKNKIFSAFLFSILALMFFNSCKKENIDTSETTPDEIIPDTLVCTLSTEILSFPEQEPPILEASTSGENGELSFIWSTGSTSSQIEPTQDALYGLTVTDELGCTAESSFDYMTTTGPCASFSVEINYIDSIPALSALVSSGTAPFFYIWSEGSTTELINVTPPGNYSVTVTDVEGCVAVDEINL